MRMLHDHKNGTACIIYHSPRGDTTCLICLHSHHVYETAIVCVYVYAWLSCKWIGGDFKNHV